jgi:hypothetical protein
VASEYGSSSFMSSFPNCFPPRCSRFQMMGRKRVQFVSKGAELLKTQLITVLELGQACMSGGIGPGPAGNRSASNHADELKVRFELCVPISSSLYLFPAHFAETFPAVFFISFHLLLSGSKSMQVACFNRCFYNSSLVIDKRDCHLEQLYSQSEQLLRHVSLK